MSGKPQVVFAVTSEGKDRWSAMASLAIACLRATNPGLFVVVACDAESDRLLRRAADPLVGEVDRWVATETPPGDPKFRNRFVKTSVRAIVDGPLLLVDSDVVVRRDLTPIFSLTADVACAPNHSRNIYREQLNDRDAAIIETMGWNISQEVYFNAGVVYFNDTPNARRVSNDWYRLWLSSYAECCDYRDQPAFNAALNDVCPNVTILQDKYNAQFKKTPSSFYEAHLWHYYAGYNELMTKFEIAIQQIVDGRPKINIVELVTSVHPWRCNGLLDSAAVGWLKRSNNGDCWAAHLLRRDLKRYFVSRFSAAARAVARFLPIHLRGAIRRWRGRPFP